jgi:effector-binding domain-containing protein
VIADIRPAGKDSLRMMIGLPVNKPAVSAQNVIFMQLPAHGRMLVGYYTGKYGGRDKLYLAMKTYLTDHHLASPEDPYEKYLDDKIPANDSSLVHLQVNFPIY